MKIEAKQRLIASEEGPTFAQQAILLIAYSYKAPFRLERATATSESTVPLLKMPQAMYLANLDELNSQGKYMRRNGLTPAGKEEVAKLQQKYGSSNCNWILRNFYYEKFL